MKMRFGQSLLLLFITASASLAQTAQEGIKYLNQERFQKAGRIFKENYKANSSAENAYYLGNFYWETNKPDSAAIYFNEGLNKDANNPWIQVGMGKVNFKKSSTDGKNYFEKALQLSKRKDVPLMVSIAEFYIETDKVEVPNAFLLLDEAQKLAPKDPEIYVVRGDGFVKIADLSKATLAYEEAIKLNPQYVNALDRLGNTYQRVFNYDLSLDYYKKALAADSLYAPAYREMGDVYFKKKEAEKAYPYYKKFIQLSDADELITFRYASYLFQSNKLDEAIAVVKPFENRPGTSGNIYRVLAYSYYEKGEYDKASQNLNKMFQILPANKLILGDYEYRGKLSLKNKQDSLASVDLEKAIGMDSSRYDLYSDLALAYMGMNKYSKAEILLEKKLKKKGIALDYLYLGKAYYYDKKYVQADTSFGSLIHLAPNYADGYLWKARVKAALDPESKKGLAKPYFEQFIQLTKTEVDKNKKELINAYEYLGYYYLLNKNKPKAKEAYLNVIEIDPNNKKASDGLKIVNAK